MLQLIRAPNEFLQMQQEEQNCLKGITKEVEESLDIHLCHSHLVEALVDKLIEDEEDTVEIAFHVVLFQ